MKTEDYGTRRGVWRTSQGYSRTFEQSLSTINFAGFAQVLRPYWSFM
jgi:hypothetical protein